ncbi:MAG: permease-like cell division protein FtsX [Actinomycetota bacterium]|nr:permease-like cell division protein FtsX [Actinomycetota bacterium]
MQLRYVFTELGQGLRRNVSMHIAVVLTLFVSLTLAGIGSLLSKEADKTSEFLGGQLKVTVWLCLPDDNNNPACTGEVTEAQKSAIEEVVAESPDVEDYYFESKERAFEKVKELLGPEQFEGPDPAATAKDLPQSYWITLKDPQADEAIKSAVIGLDGVSYIEDARAQLAPVYDTIDALKYSSWVGAGFLILAAVLLVANTIRLAAFARRKEIAIMRLVGASTLYITLPFLLEAVVTAMFGVLLAAGALAAFTQFGIIDRLSETINFLPWVGWDEYFEVLIELWPPGLLVLGGALTLVPTLLLTRKYIKV